MKNWEVKDCRGKNIKKKSYKFIAGDNTGK